MAAGAKSARKRPCELCTAPRGHSERRDTAGGFPLHMGERATWARREPGSVLGEGWHPPVPSCPPLISLSILIPLSPSSPCPLSQPVVLALGSCPGGWPGAE